MGIGKMIVLDTHAWLWWVNATPDTLPDSVIQTIETSDSVGVAAISCLEVAMLARRNRIALPCPLPQWFQGALSASQITLLPMTPEIAIASTELPDIHRDPADRLILATATTHRATLISKDQRMRQYPGVDILWA
jgi:PIN domain nuclease of toxin-antitoxin system